MIVHVPADEETAINHINGSDIFEHDKINNENYTSLLDKGRIR